LRRTNRSSSRQPHQRRTPGLFKHILPLFKQKTGIDVKVVSQGTGQALDTGGAAMPT
jgi:ABC-type tungstate transport system permease subunit